MSRPRKITSADPKRHPRAVQLPEVDFENDASVMRWETAAETKARLRRIRAAIKRQVMKELSKVFPIAREQAIQAALQVYYKGDYSVPFHFDLKIRKGDIKRPTDRFTIPYIAAYTNPSGDSWHGRVCKGNVIDSGPASDFQLIPRSIHRRKASVPPHYIHEYSLTDPAATPDAATRCDATRSKA